ncbi:hypothetical protein [Corallococcus exercitus]|uniref:DUF4360 domain-containing protein n=1 Tax=Corallococcus exercitus TaxID=2316736 RepID=A0A7Y4NGJ9_9BACT|nr:hypothetical protein [Corallococcus exercitus]NOK12671.1 hypothetical protein [Corallococcus exercitus]
MHTPLREPLPFLRTPFALVLSLAVLGGTGCGRESSVTGLMRVRHGDVWEDYPSHAYTWIRPNENWPKDFDIEPVFTFCNSDSPPGEFREGSRGLCVNVDFESFARGRGPASYAIEGTVQVPAEGWMTINNHVDFQAGPGHSPGLKEAWTRSFCPEAEGEEDATQRVSGRFVLEENSEDRVRGHLELTVEGQTGGTCPGEAAEVDLGFDIDT